MEGDLSVIVTVTSQLGAFSGIHQWVRGSVNHQKLNIVFLIIINISVGGIS